MENKSLVTVIKKYHDLKLVFIMLSKFKTLFSIIIHNYFIFSIHLEGNQYVSVWTSCCPRHGVAAKRDLGSSPAAESPENPLATRKLVQMQILLPFTQDFHLLASMGLWASCLTFHAYDFYNQTTIY